MISLPTSSMEHYTNSLFELSLVVSIYVKSNNARHISYHFPKHLISNLQENQICHLKKRKVIDSKMPSKADMLVPRRVLETKSTKMRSKFHPAWTIIPVTKCYGKSPEDRVVPLPNGLLLHVSNGGDPITTYTLED